MAAPKLTFSGGRATPRGKKPPPKPIRNPKEHGFFSNLWSGIESVPGGIKDQEESYRHAIAHDIASQSGVVGAVSYPWELYLGTALALGGGKKDKARLKKIAAAPTRHKRSALDVLAEPLIKEGYHTTKQATGGYGWKKTKEIWHDNPVAAIGSAAIFVAPAARLAGIGVLAKDISAANRVPLAGGGTRAMTRAEATKLATVESYYPGSLDAMGLEGSPFKPRISGRAVSRNPIGRAGQKAFDWASEKVDESSQFGPGTPLSATRRIAAGARRADDLDRSRLITNAMRHVTTFADYLNDGYGERIRTALGGRREVLAGRDAAVGAALHASSAIDPVEAVAHAATSTRALIDSGVRDAHYGDIADLPPDKRVGQTVFVTHGINEDGDPIRVRSTVIDSTDERVTVRNAEGEEHTIKNERAHLAHEGEENKIPLSDDEIKMLERRHAMLSAAHQELLDSPRLQEKFRAATQSMTDFGQLNEKLGEDYFTRGLDPTGSEAIVIRERLDARRNQFLDQLGGEGAEAIDYYSGLWGDLQKAMDAHGNFTDQQQFVFLSLLDRQARVWANEVEGRSPQDYLSSPEGMRLGGIDFSKPEDLEATLNAMFQRAGERNDIVTTSTTALLDAPAKTGDLVSTPAGMGRVTDINKRTGLVRIEMIEGPDVYRSFPQQQVRVSAFPWIGHPQIGDYVMTPDGPGVVEASWEGPGPDFVPGYQVNMIEFRDAHGRVELPGHTEGMAYPGESVDWEGHGLIQRINDPRDVGAIFHLNSQQALGQPKFPTKGTASQYRAAFDKAGVKADEYYWMGLTRVPLLEHEIKSLEAKLRKVEQRNNEDSEWSAVYGDEEWEKAHNKLTQAQTFLADYLDNPDPHFILDAYANEGSFPVQAIQDKVNSSANFLNMKETLYSTNSPSTQWQDRWGPSRTAQGQINADGLTIRTPTEDEPYHELIISLPTSDLYRTGHWDDIKAPVVHIRFHEIIDNEGKRAILIDELQSDWNNAGRKWGWKREISRREQLEEAHFRNREAKLAILKDKMLNELDDRIDPRVAERRLADWFHLQVRKTMTTMNEEINARNAEKIRKAGERDKAVAAGENYDGWQDTDSFPESALYEYSQMDLERAEQRWRREIADNEIDTELAKLYDGIVRINERMMRFRTAADTLATGGSGGNAINRGPLVMGDAAKYLAMKRMIRWAADHDQTRIIWTRGREHGVRYRNFQDVPIEDLPSGGHALNPDDYQDEFSYWTTDMHFDFGGISFNPGSLNEAQVKALKEQPPFEVSWDDLDYGEYRNTDSGKKYALMGAEKHVPEEVKHPQLYTPERHVEVLRSLGDTAVVRPIDPSWDPTTLQINWRSDMGTDSSWGTYEVQIHNRLGERVFYEDIAEDKFATLSGLMDTVGRKMERNYRQRVGLGADTVDGEIIRMREMIDIINSSEVNLDYWQDMIDGETRHFDEWAFNDYEANQDFEDNWNEVQNPARGDFKDLRDFTPRVYTELERQENELRNLKLAKEQRTEALLKSYTEVPSGALDELTRQISQLEHRIQQFKKTGDNLGLDYAYDRMLPQSGDSLLRPYRKDEGYTKVHLKDEIYRGRYSTEQNGIISEEGNLPGWVMDIPERALKDAKSGTESLFQKGNDIVKGASTWVGGPDGQRFIALTADADFSTLMHEFIGHATEEMARRYPELWEAVERDMGKPLAEWKVKDHERFAKQVERYFMEGKALSPELHAIMGMIKEWMKAVYASITQLGKPMPESTRALLNRHLGQGITARPGARAYVPHVSQFDTLLDTTPGPTRLAAGGNMVGKTNPDKRNFGARRNRGILWQSGELALSARPIIDQYFRRTKFLETEAIRRELYEGGHPMPKNGRPPKNAWMIRNPDGPLDKLMPRNTTKMSDDDFARLIGEGDTPEEFATKMNQIKEEHYAAPGEHPSWANDLENTRWVEGPKIEQRLSNVFPSAPRGRVGAGIGAANTLARMAGIYLRPLHYLVGNIPQNVMMVALTNPSALVNSVKYGAYSFLPRVIREMGKGPGDLFAHDRHLYNRIKTETGDIQAGAGLPDFYTVANNNFQRTEKRLNKISQGTAEKLGEVADQPYRVSVWIAHAKKYGYDTPEEWTKLLDSERGTPEARIRDEIAQKTREDMIDFNTLSPWERQHISRFFYLWAFTRGFAKWPITFAREYPGRTGLALMTADPERTDDNGINIGALPSSGVLKSNQGRGRVRDLDFLDPTQGIRQQIETGISAAHGNFSGIGGMTTPPMETALQAITGGPRAPKGGLGGIGDQLLRDTVPFYDIGRKVSSPGLGVSDRVLRFLDADRFSVKDELGKGKNYEKKRGEDKQIHTVLKKAERLDVLEQVQHSQDAYWHHKYLEQQIRFGAQARRKGTSLNDKEKLTILYATARDYYPQLDLPPLTQALQADPALQEEYRTQLRDAMFGPRNEVLG